MGTGADKKSCFSIGKEEVFQYFNDGSSPVAFLNMYAYLGHSNTVYFFLTESPFCSNQN